MLLPSTYLESFSKIYASQTPSGVQGPFPIHRYRNASHDADEKPDTSAAPGIALKNKIITALRDRYTKITGNPQSGDWIVIPPDKAKDWFPGLELKICKPWIVQAFSGKGRPFTIDLALSAGFCTGLITASTVHDICEECIGLDCNGYVGGYAKTRGLTGSDDHLGPSSPPSIFASRGTPRNTWNEIRPHDVLLTPGSPEHVRIVQARYDTYLDVCESASSLRGLSRRAYFRIDESFGNTMVNGFKGKARMYKLTRQTLAGGWSDHWVLACGVGF
ncbi:MAG: hypothetical protein JNK48_19420 [Bryobacterales bacterium]|nr:hypothetical protein [Bryobacterales bacterium]